MRYVSLFSGIEAASCAWGPLGWEAVAFSEIDPFCNAVLATRFPSVPNLGDISKVEWKEMRGEIDVVIGGSPCQSFSVAGKRTGLKGESGLMLEFIRAVCEVTPRCFVWENVPGALSSENGEAFRCLLRAMDEVGYGLAWRILDAQFFGLAQRRERVFLVGVLGSAARACEILFEPHCMRWDHPPGKEKRALLAAAAGGGARTAGFKYSAAPASGSVGHAAEQSPTLTADWHAPAVYGIVGNSIGRKPENGGNGAGFCDPDEKGMYTLTAADRHAVALPAGGPPREALCLASTHANAHVGDGLCGCLTANVAKGPPMACLSGDAANAACDVDLAGTLKVGGSPSCVGPVAAFAQNTRDEVRFVGGSGSHVGALAAHPGVKQASHVLQGPAVRRLTPLECERLQGFPDNWTNVEFRGKPAPDGRRYRALGNAMAVPVVKWIGERVEKAV